MNNRSLITLITDFGTASTYTGVMKGVILSINPRCTVVDITHQIVPQDIQGTCFALDISYRYFPKGTIHLVVVDPGVGSKRRPIVVAADEYFFVGPDNGVFSPVLTQSGQKTVYELSNDSYFLPAISTTFHGRDIFAPAAAHLSRGTPPSCFGPVIQDYVIMEWPKPVVSNSAKAEGEIIHIDRFGNLITNFSIATVKSFMRVSGFCVEVKGRKIDRLLSAYADGKQGELFCIFGSSGFLEIAVKNASAQQLLNAQVGDKVTVFIPPHTLDK